MQFLSNEVERLIRFDQPYCALDAFEEFYEKYDLNNQSDKTYLSYILSNILFSEVRNIVLDYLVEKKFDFTISFRDKGGLVNLLINASRLSKLDNEEKINIINKVIEYGADIYEVDQYGNNFLHVIAKEQLAGRSLECRSTFFALSLLNKDNISSLLSSNNSGKTPLNILFSTQIALGYPEKRNMTLINKIFELYTDYDEYELFDLLVDSCKMGCFDLMKLLINKGANPKMTSSSGLSVVHYLVEGEREVYLEMIDYLDTIDIPNDNGLTPLLYTLNNQRSKTPDFWSLLVKKGADVNACDNKGENALFKISRYEIKTAKLFVEHNIDINKQNNLGLTPLMKAIKEKNTNLISYLIDIDADLTIVDNKENSALSYAVESNVDEYVKLVMDKMQVNQ